MELLSPCPNMKVNGFANSADPDETAQNDLLCYGHGKQYSYSHVGTVS